MKCTDCNRPIKPVVALDIDGTLANYHKHFLQFAAGWLGETPWHPRTYDGATDMATFMGLSKETYRTIKLAYRQGGLKRTMPMFKDAARITQWLVDDGVEVWITTTRPYMRLDNVDPDTQHWLQRNRILYSGLVYDEHKYDRLIEIVGADRVAGVLEDLPDKFDRAMELGLHPVYYGTPYNAAIRREPRATTLRYASLLLTDQVTKWKANH